MPTRITRRAHSMPSGKVGTPPDPNGGGGASPAPAPQRAKEMLLVSSVTAPFRAKALPTSLAPVFMVMLVSARILPRNVVLVSMVAELLTCHWTPHGLPPLIVVTTEFGE